MPDPLVMARVTAARVVSLSAVGMVDRDVFDGWLRERAAGAGAVRRAGTFMDLSRDGVAAIHHRPRSEGRGRAPERVRARAVIGADGAARWRSCSQPAASST